MVAGLQGLQAFALAEGGSEPCHQLANGVEGEEEPGWVGWQGLKAIAFVERLAPCRAVGVAAIQHIQQRYSDAEGIRRLGDTPQRIHQQIGPKPARL